MKYKNISIWSEIPQDQICNSLNEDIYVDVLIIGGGITGLSTAYHLINSNLKICLVEKNEIAHGVSSRTTGKLTFLQKNLCSKISKYHGHEKMKLYIESQIEAIKIVQDIIEKEKIECNFEKVSSYLFSNTDPEKVKKELKEYSSLCIKTNTIDKLPNDLKTDSAFYIQDTYVFHPIKYLYALKNIILKKNVSIYENTNILSINKRQDHFECKTKYNLIKAKYIVLATHYPYFLFPFLLPLKTTIEKSYIGSYKVKENLKFSAITVSKPTISIRYYSDNNKNYEIYLSNSHSSCFKFNEQDNFNELFHHHVHPTYIWSNKDIMTNDSLPYIGYINNNDNILIGTGYNTWGMTNGSLAGKILADIILNKQNKYIELFSPLRKLNIGQAINFPVSIASSVYSIIKTKINKQKAWYPDNIKFEKRNGKNVAIYIDENKKEHIVYNLCPHMKCSLIFNVVEKTWDCPCHGSRFDIDGNVIEGPSNYNITFKK